MENTVTKDVILDKKLNDYHFESKDFLARQELTVTITLAEYRELVSGIATKKADIDKAESDKWQRNSEIESLTKENADLKAELYELRKRLELGDENASD